MSVFMNIGTEIANTTLHRFYLNEVMRYHKESFAWRASTIAECLDAYVVSMVTVRAEPQLILESLQWLNGTILAKGNGPWDINKQLIVALLAFNPHRPREETIREALKLTVPQATLLTNFMKCGYAHYVEMQAGDAVYEREPLV